MKNFQNTAILVILLGLVVYTVYDKVANKPKPVEPEIRYEQEILNITLPEQMDFCGEPVPLKEPDVREKLDYELHSNTFFHSNTILIMKRANRWFPQMRKILQKNDIPEDFLYLVVIESNLQNLISPAGATGFWQFMRPTAKEMGLEVNKEVDERYDAIKSTKAACKYLKQAYKRFGDWTLVAASYNMGMRGISRELEQQKADSYYDLSLNRETARYVYRILAMKEILSSPEKYQFKIPPGNLYWKQDLKDIKVTKTISDLASFAQKQGISYKTLKYYNPWLRTNKLTVGRNESYEIVVPADAKPISKQAQES